MSAFLSACRTTWKRSTVHGKWNMFVMDRIHDRQQASNLLSQSWSHPVLDILRQEEFFFPAIVSFWFENSYTLPTTVTKATEYAVIHHAEMYCKENNVEVENLRELVKVRFNDIGKCLYEHITEENVGKLNPAWIDESISNLDSYLFGLLTKSEDVYTFQSNYVYSYMTAVYVSNTITLSPHNIPLLLREQRMKTWQTYLPYCFPYISGILGDKASCFLNELATHRLMQTSVNINSLEFIGSCLFESEMPSVFTRDIEKLIGQNHTLDLSTCTGISNQSMHTLSVLLQNTSLIQYIKLYTENDESSLSSDFKECLANIMSDPLTVDRCTVRINNCHDFTVMAKLLRVLPLLYKNAISKSGSDTTLQLVVSSLTISSSVSIPEEINVCAMKMFMKALSFMPHLEKLNLTGLGNDLCEQFLVCLSEETVCLNINTLCLAENGLSWKHCQLLSEALNAMPCLTSLDVSSNNVSILGCILFLPIIDEIEVRVDDNSIAHGLFEIIPLCTSTAQLQDVGDLSLKSLDDVASLIRNLENVRHIHCTKLGNSQLSTLCQNLSVLGNIISIDLSGRELNKQIVLLLTESLKHLQELQKVDLSHCCVSTDDMKLLLQYISPVVTDLNLSDTNMPDILLTELKRFSNLKYLNISSNKLKANDHIFRFIPTSVTQLNLSHNDLEGWSFVKLDSYTQLEDLDLSHNKFTLVDMQEILKLISTSITVRNVSNNNLKRTEESFKHLTQLKQLNMSNNGLASRSNVSLPSSITHLNLSLNQMAYYTHSFNHLTTLIHLNVSHNKITYIFPIISYLSQLTHLDVSHNNISYIGQSFTNLTKLRHLDMSHNKIYIGQSANHLSQLTHLDVSHNRLRYICESANHISQLKYLNMSHNLITDIRQSVKHLSQLTHLDASHNEIKYIGKGFNHLSQLAHIDVSHNLIADIGRTFTYLSQLTHLNVSHNQIPYISQSFIHLLQLTNLDMSHNKVKQSLIDILKYLPTTSRYLDFSSNCIENVENFGNVISSFNDLQAINLGSNKFHDIGIQNLLNDIRSTDMAKIGVSHNFTLMPHIIDQIPNVSTNLEQDNLRLSHVKNSSVYENLMHIKEVNVSGLSEGECSGICKSLILLENLTKLVMTECCLKNVLNLTISLKHLNALKKLDLSNNQLDSEMVCHIIRVLPCTLISLNLSHNLVEGEFPLKHLTKLQRLDLSHNNLQLPLHFLILNVPETLKYLDVSFNKIQNVDHVGKLISDFSQLCYINMNSNQIGAVGVQTLYSEIESYDINCDIDVSHMLNGLQKVIPYIANRLPTSGILPDFERENLTLKDKHFQAFFKTISQITTVEIPKNVEWSETDYKCVLNDLLVFSNLESLTLAMLNPTTFLFLAEILKHFSCLRHLDISGSRIYNQGVKVVGNALFSLEKLAYINFSNTNIGMLDIKFLLEIYRRHINQPFINVAKNVHYLPFIFPYINDQLNEPSIEDIDFDSDELPVKTFASLVQMTTLTKLKVKEKQWVDKDFNSFVQGLNYLNLTYLDLSHNNIGNRGAKSLREGTRSMHGLTHLDLNHNNIGDSGVKSLSTVMILMDELTHLDLSHNNIGDSGTKSLSARVRSMHGLTHLDLSHNNIGDSGVMSLSEAMVSMRGLIHLDLSHNNMGDSGAESLSEGISSIDALTHLHLGHTNIGDSGAEGLSEGMRSMHRLSHLELSDNNIGDSGTESLGERMRSIRDLLIFILVVIIWDTLVQRV